MIPQGIQKFHIIEAIRLINRQGHNKGRQSSKYFLHYERENYPPKQVISSAAFIATGQVLEPTQFKGGKEANNFLRGLGFEVIKKSDDWSWKECYFAVWAYDQIDQGQKNKEQLFSHIFTLIGRSKASVGWKVSNVAFFDPRPQEDKPIRVATNAQKLVGEVFNWYWADKVHARKLYDNYLEESKFGITSHDAPQEIKAVMIEEGEITPSHSLKRKRSQLLLKEGRHHFRQLNKGLLKCSACELTTPLGIEAEIIQLHHTKPLYDSDAKGQKLDISEAIRYLLPLCPTCHVLAHTKKPPLTLEEIKRLRNL